MLRLKISIPLAFIGLLALVASPVSANLWNENSEMISKRDRHTATLLQDGTILVAGGYGETTFHNSAEVYDAAKGRWSSTANRLTYSRASHTASLLLNGRVLVAGGVSSGNLPVATAELYNPTTRSWSQTGVLNTPRNQHTATLLANGKVLVAGGTYYDGENHHYTASAELYDPVSGTWTATGSLNFARSAHTATRMPDGKVLVAGGYYVDGLTSYYLTSAELYDPDTGLWSTINNLNVGRNGHAATLLPNGDILVTGGSNSQNIAGCEVYISSSGSWTVIQSMSVARVGHTATLLPNGNVVVTGGFSNGQYLNTSEIYNSTAEEWTEVAEMVDPRTGHTATLFPDGKIFLVGGRSSTGYGVLSTSESYDASTGIWNTGPVMNAAAGVHTATLLPNGKVLVAGGLFYDGEFHYLDRAELYDPNTGIWDETGRLNGGYSSHTATLLPNGKVLVAGGYNSLGRIKSAELFDSNAGAWTETDSLHIVRYGHTATLLPNGKVLAAGGESTTGSTELFDPVTETWTWTGSLNHARENHTATLLSNGKVLVAGGSRLGTYLTICEIYDPETGVWVETGGLNYARGFQTATLLPGGKVLVAGGYFYDGEGHYLKTAEVYDPVSGTWTVTRGNMNFGRSFHTATLLLNGNILVAGGYNYNYHDGDYHYFVRNAEEYDPSTGYWIIADDLNTARQHPTATLLREGTILITGGDTSSGYTNGTELYDPGLGFDSLWRPAMNNLTPILETGHDAVQVTGSGFMGLSEGSGGNGSQDSSTGYPLVQLRRLDNDQLRWLRHDPDTLFNDTTFVSNLLTEFPDGHSMVTVFANAIPSVPQIILIDNPPFVRSITYEGSNPTNAQSVSFTVTFSKSVTGVETSDFIVHMTGSLSGATVQAVAGGGDVYTVFVSGYDNQGTIRLDLTDNDSIRDEFDIPLGGTGNNNGDHTTGDLCQIDRIAPYLSSVTVANNLSVEVIFTEAMGSGVESAANYSISGPGTGSLSVNPDSVTHQYDNIYRLSWNGGEMKDGGDVSVTVVNVQDSVGNLIGMPNSATDVGGGIGIAPVTDIDHAGGTYASGVTVTLECSDVGGAGCSTTFYSMDGNPPATVYTAPVAITQNTVLKFYSMDAAGNAEPVRTEIYAIEIPSVISCNLSPDTLTFGEGFTLSGSISPHPNQANQGVGILLTPPAGDPIQLSTNAAADGSFTRNVACDVLFAAGAWKAQTSWSGDASHLPATSAEALLTVQQARSSLTLDVVTAEAVKVNSRPPVGGSFSPDPSCAGMDLSGTPILVYAAEPENGPVHTLTAFTNRYGQFLLNYDTAQNGSPFDFDVLGEWKLSAAYAATNEFAGAATDPVAIRVIPTAGYAILVQGRVASGEGMPSHHKTASFVYEKLRDRQILADDIQYLSWMYSDGWDGDPSKSNIQNAVTVWARDKMDPDFVHPNPALDKEGQPGDLYIIMIDHGWTDPLDDEEGVFYIHPDDPLTSSELAAWVTDLQSHLAGTVSQDRNIVVILGFCRAGAFIEDLSDNAYGSRVIIASAAKNEASHRGPQDVDEEGQPLRDGEYFVSEFFKSVSYGKSIKHSFEEATALTEEFTASGSGEVNAPFYDDSIQHPLLDDNGDGSGSNELSDDAGEDGHYSQTLFIGASPPQGNDPGDVLVTGVNPAVFLDIGETAADLWAAVDSPGDLRMIWVEIKAPRYDPADPGAGLQIEMETFKKATTEVAGSAYTWKNVGAAPDPVDLFATPGTYQVFYFAKDDDTGHVSPLVQSRVYKALEGNSPPGAFALLAPADQASVLTTTVLAWEDAVDPDGDSLTYTVLISKNDDQFGDPIRIEGLANSSFLIGPEHGIQDLSTYYWKVQAVDSYGALRETAVRAFHTDNTNPVAGWVKGFVYNAVTQNAVTNAALTFGGTNLNSALNGYYLGVVPPGPYTVEVSAPGFFPVQAPVTIPEGSIVSRNFGLTPDTEPTAAIVSPAGHTTIMVGDMVDFQGSAVNGEAPISFAWDFDGGAPGSTLEDPGPVVFELPGSYLVQLTVTDSDGDWHSDTVLITVETPDLCPEDPNKLVPGVCGCGTPDTDTDGDAEADCVDSDDDDDGMPDAWEAFYGLLPLVDDADGDLDGDGHTNLEEYLEDSDPTDPRDPRPRAMPWLPILLE